MLKVGHVFQVYTKGRSGDQRRTSRPGVDEFNKEGRVFEHLIKMRGSEIQAFI